MSVVLVVDLVYAVVVTRGHLLFAHLVRVFAAAAYIMNWIGALGGSPPADLDHLWSLSVEEQFYILWPVALMLLVRRT